MICLICDREDQFNVSMESREVSLDNDGVLVDIKITYPRGYICPGCCKDIEGEIIAAAGARMRAPK